MSTTQTLREPKRRRSRGSAIQRDVVETKPETAQEWYRRWCREVDEWQNNKDSERKICLQGSRQKITGQKICNHVSCFSIRIP